MAGAVRAALTPVFLLVLVSACSARATDTTEVPLPAVPASPSSGVGETGTLESAPTLGRAGAEAPKGALPAHADADLVIDWDRVRRHAGADPDRGVNVKRNDPTGGVRPQATPSPSPIASPADGAGTPR